MVLNVTYALLAERADARDYADMGRWGDVDDKSRDNLGNARKDLDDWLASPYGEAAKREKAVVAYLTA